MIIIIAPVIIIVSGMLSENGDSLPQLFLSHEGRDF